MFTPDDIEKLDEIKEIMNENRYMFDKYLMVAFTEECSMQHNLMMKAVIYSELTGRRIRLSVTKGLRVPDIVIERCHKIVYHEGKKDLVQAMKVLFKDDE